MTQGAGTTAATFADPGGQGRTYTFTVTGTTAASTQLYPIQQIASGYGFLANDLYAPFDEGYYGDQLPQRHQDIDKAKSLLKAAGKEGLTVDLHTTNGASGMVPSR